MQVCRLLGTFLCSKRDSTISTACLKAPAAEAFIDSALIFIAACPVYMADNSYPKSHANSGSRACLVVIDGWGLSDPEAATKDAIRTAQPPFMTELLRDFPNVALQAHGPAVGLPEGLMGNSEVGHLNLGAGRVVYQDIVRIDKAIAEGSFNANPALLAAFNQAQQGSKRIHLVGLLSDGGVHSHIRHLKALISVICNKAPGLSILIHAITDGRDTAPSSAKKYLDELLGFISDQNRSRKGTSIKLVTVTGRYWAMDRDQRWERTETAFNAMTQGNGENVVSGADPLALDAALMAAIDAKYAAGETDEFFKPMIVDAEGLIGPEDAIVFFNFRSDRMRQICQMFLNKRASSASRILTMTKYKAEFPFPVLSEPQTMSNVLAEWLASQKRAQCHVAETEKYAHVTFFFNGGQERQFEGEERVLIPSPKVATYDLQPSMSVAEVAQAMAEAVCSGRFDFVMGNLAPPDMVGHTGKFEETVEAVLATDRAIKRIHDACAANGFALFITSDHGNAEQMTAVNGTPHTAHTCAPVPFICTDKSAAFADEKRGSSLCDVAPTILSYMGLPIPTEMTGHSLLSKS
jgi:2,3-bisphosphoglycerate-independent phosphoglycerate mutase